MKTPSEPVSPQIKPGSAEDMARGRAIYAAKRAEWAKLELRQTFMDEAFMRAILAKAGVRIGSDLEPATPPRLLQMIRRAGFTGMQLREAVGCDAQQFLELNSKPRPLPLWAATALVLEALGVLPHPQESP